MNETPIELRGVESLLDTLAREERASAPSGLEGRVFAGSVQALEGCDGPAALGRAVHIRTALASKHARTVAPVTFRLFSPLRVAAGLGLAAAVGAIGLAGLRSTTPDTAGAMARSNSRYEALDSKVDSLLAWKSPMGEGFEGLGEQIDLLYADLTDFSLDTDSPEDAFFEGGAL